MSVGKLFVVGLLIKLFLFYNKKVWMGVRIYKEIVSCKDVNGWSLKKKKYNVIDVIIYVLLRYWEF